MISSSQPITPHQFKSLIHPTEHPRFVLAILAAIPAAMAIAGIVIMSNGTVIIPATILLGLIWLAYKILQAQITGSAVRVSPNNFPEIHKILQNIQTYLDYHKNVTIYIVEDGTVNAFLMSFFSTRFIILNSSLVHSMSSDSNSIKQIEWIIGRFIGALCAKHARLIFLHLLVNSIKQFRILNLLILPYERATQYTGDQIGLVVCGDFEEALNAFNKLLIGKDLHNRVALRGLLFQANDVKNSIFGTIAKLLSTHPHMTDRYLNLMAFARCNYPEQFREYVNRFDHDMLMQIGTLLPQYYPIPESNKTV